MEKLTIHNINSKQVPLTSEENLRLILQDSTLFDDKTLLESQSFGPAYYLARKVLADIEDRYLAGLAKPLENRRTLALSLTQFLVARDDTISQAKDAATLDAQVPRLRNAFQMVNAIYQRPNRDKLRENGCHGVLIAFLYFSLQNEGKQLQAFERWVVNNRIDHLAPASTIRGLGYHYHLGPAQAVDVVNWPACYRAPLAPLPLVVCMFGFSYKSINIQGG